MFSEGINTELKREYTDDIKKTVIAFANTDGGDIYIGINDDGSVEGVNDADSTMLKLSSTIKDSICPDVSIFTFLNIIKLEGKDVIELKVERGTARPYYLCGKGIRPAGVYIRQGSATVPASETAIINMIKESSGYSFERSRSLRQDLSFTKAEELFREKDVLFDEAHKRTLRLIGEDGMYTNLALILSEQCPHQTKAAVFQGTDKLVFKNRKEFSGSIFSQMEEAFKFIDFYNQTRSEINGLYRIDSRDYPEEAVREAVLNAYVHRDYSFASPLLISIFDDRMEIVTVGGLLKGISLDDIKLGVSALRNKALANVFYRLELIEAYGTGIMKIERAYRDCDRKPLFEVSANAFKVTLPNLHHPKRIDNIFYLRQDSPAYGSSPLTGERIEAVKELCRKQGSIVRKDIEKAFSVSQPMAIIILRDMLKSGVLKRVGKGKNIRYVLDI